jgi:glycosyltransferase involved in cell wall biosynthesis
MSSRDPRLSILHVILALKPTNCQYNEHCLPLIGERDLAICTYFRSSITPPAGITLFDGDGSLRGFHRTLKTALLAREYDVIHVHTPHAGLLLLVTLLLSGLYRRTMPRTVHTVHNSFKSFSLRNKLLFLPSFPAYERLVFCSHAAYESFPRLYKWLGGDRMSVVQNAVHLDRIDKVARRERAARSSRFTIATVGLIAMKNPLTLLQAFRADAAADSRLVFIGEGSLRPLIERDVEATGLRDRVETTGLIERDQVFQRFADADLFVSTSWGEGLPVAVLEAMACGLPVILSDIPPHREIAEGVSFIPLVDPGDGSGFTREIRRFREMPASERVAIGRRCRALIEERFGLPTMHAGYARVYAQLPRTSVPALLEGVPR